jgi:conjugal transfer pilus assembly protein TraV
MFRTRSVFIAAVGALALSQAGCGTTSRFACGAPQGIPCLSVQEVYDRTEFSSSITAGSAAPAPHVSVQTMNYAATGEPSSAPVVIEEGSLMIAPTDSSPAPVSDALLTGARVIRVWVAPWEDRRGDLHMSGFVFSEVQGRRWRIGNTTPTSHPVLRLLESTSISEPTPAGAGS